MIVLVAGGRDYDDKAKLYAVLDDVLASSADGHVKIINGGCRGADQLATCWAREKGEAYIEVQADWTTHGKNAGPLRNQAMIDIHRPDVGIVFPGNAGTLDMLSRLFWARVETRVIKP